MGNAFQDLAQPEVPSPGTYAATATPFEGGSHSVLDPTPSMSGNPSQGLGPAPSQGVAGAGYRSLGAHDPAAEDQQQSQVRPALPCSGAAIIVFMSCIEGYSGLCFRPGKPGKAVVFYSGDWEQQDSMPSMQSCSQST